MYFDYSRKELNEKEALANMPRYGEINGVKNIKRKITKKQKSLEKLRNFKISPHTIKSTYVMSKDPLWRPESWYHVSSNHLMRKNFGKKIDPTPVRWY
jgi:hypothetical protein